MREQEKAPKRRSRKALSHAPEGRRVCYLGQLDELIYSSSVCLKIMENKPKPKPRPAKGKPAKPAQSSKAPRRRKPRNGKKEVVVVGSREANSDLQLVRSLKEIAKDRTELCRDYVAHLVDPAHTKPVRLPDASIGMNKTGLVTSVMSIDVMANMSTDGRFAMVVSPTLGDASDPSFYKIAMADTSGSFPTDFSLPASFSQTSGTTSLTVDPNSSMLVQPTAISYAAATSSLIVTPASSDPMGITPGIFQVLPITSDAWNPALGAAPIQSTAVVGTAQASIFTLPPGQWDVNVAATFVAPNAAVRLIMGTNDLNVSVSNQAFNTSTTDPDADSIVSVYGTSGTFYVIWSAAPSQNYNPYMTINSSWLRPDRLINPAPGYPLDGGYVREYVPVAMSVLATCVLPELYNGGNIATAWLPPGVCDADIFTSEPRPQVGNLMLVENLRRFPGAYDGAMKDGAYSIWRPASFDDCTLRKPTEVRDRPWPCLAVAGQVITAGLTGQKLAIRLQVHTTYQYYTDIVCFPLQTTDGSRAIMEEAFRLLQTFPMSSANGPHWENIKSFFRKALNFVSDNSGAIGMIGKGILTLASVF